jgi:hypothetical protein
MGSIYLFFFAFFFAAIGLFSSYWEIRVRAMANLLRPGASVTPYVVVRGQLVKRNLQGLGGLRFCPPSTGGRCRLALLRRWRRQHM